MRLTIQLVVMIFLSLFITINTSANSSEEIEVSNGEVVKVFFEPRSNGYRYEVEFENGNKYFYEKSEDAGYRSEEHTSELQSRENIVCRLLLEKKNNVRTYKI